MVNILYSFDTKFWKLALASIYSVLKTKQPETVYTFYCMVAPYTKGRRKIERLVKRSGCRLVWRVVRPRENPYRAVDYVRWSPVIFHRLFAHKIFPNVDRMIYLDSDTIVLEDLTRLFEFDIKNSPLGGVPDFGAALGRDEHIKVLLGQKINSGTYVNSGVLLINLSKMPELLSVDCELMYPDQDLINIGLDGRISELPMRYNYIPHQENLPPEIYTADPAIYHFYSIKPYYQNNPQSYLMFEKLVENLGMTPHDFVKHERKYSSTKSNIPFVRLHGNKIKFLGITLVRI
ncbi:MAG: hypothetical protein LBF37_00870 [Rickettsiales bacterium]|jgi:lipopolysaccharide biosynthesis glycosyltransferase|nr:hypothetical protein [Rickettsiales bacterium]